MASRGSGLTNGPDLDAEFRGLPCLVLASGGLDSTSLVALLTQLDEPVRLLFVDYGQLGAARERSAARAIAQHYDVEIDELDLSINASTKPSLPGRNGFLVHAALLHLWPFVGTIALGIHDGSQYPDCSPEFVRQTQSLLDLYCGGVVRLVTPFVSWMKGDIYKFALGNAVPIGFTYSCDLGLDQPCGRCLSCRDVTRRDVGA